MMFKASFSDVRSDDPASSESGLMKMAAFGRRFQVGMLFDCRSDALLSAVKVSPSAYEDLQGSASDDDDQSIVSVGSSVANGFNQKKTSSTSGRTSNNRPKDRPNDKVELNVEKFNFDKGPSSKFHHLNLDVNQQASVMAGLVEASSGASLYLKDETDTSQAARVLLVRLIIQSHPDEVILEDKEPEETGNATHIVSAVKYGAEAYVVLQRYLEEEEVKEDIEREMDEDLEKLIESLYDGTEPEFSTQETLGTFYGDLHVRPRSRRSFSDVFKLVRDMMTEIENDPSRAVPITIWLRSLRKVGFIRPLNEDVLAGCRRIFDGFERVKAAANLLTFDEEIKMFPVQRKYLFDFMKCIDKYVVLFRQELKKLIPAIRSGQKDNYAIRSMIDLVENGFFHPTNLNRWLSKKQSDFETLRLIARLAGQGHLKLVTTKKKMDLILDDIEWKWILALVLPALDDRVDPTLKVMEDYVDFNQRIHREVIIETGRGEDLSSSFATDSVRQELRELARQMALQAGREKKDRVLFVMTSVLEGPSPYRPAITLYEEGRVVKKEFQLPAQPVNVQLNANSSVQNFYRVEWECEEMEDVVDFIVEYKGPRDAHWTSITSGLDKSIRLDDVRDASGYHFRVASVSVIGRSEYSSIFKVQSVPEICPSAVEIQLQDMSRRIGTMEKDLHDVIPNFQDLEDDLRIKMQGLEKECLNRQVLVNELHQKIQDCTMKLAELQQAHDKDVDHLLNKIYATGEKVNALDKCQVEVPSVDVVESFDSKIKELKNDLALKLSMATQKTTVRVFEACCALQRTSGTYVTYRVLNFPKFHESTEHGDLDHEMGLFKAKKTGEFEFHFHGKPYGKTRAQVQLRVNGAIIVSSTFIRSSPLCIDSKVTLKCGDEVGVFVNSGNLYECGNGTTKFSGMFLS